MKCAICGENTAEIHIKEIIDSEDHVLDICKECADANHILELYMELGVTHYDGIQKLGINKTPFKKIKTDKNVKLTKKAVCKECGYSLKEFLDVHLLSCPACYKYFKTYLGNLIKKIYNQTAYIGKVPQRKKSLIYKQNKKKELEIHLESLIQNESYEEAAEVRDAIIRLDGEIASSVYKA